MGDPESIRVPLPGTSVQPTSDNEPTLFKILQGGDILATDGVSFEHFVSNFVWGSFSFAPKPWLVGL